MEPFRLHTGIVAPLDRANIDTDAIIPKQFLKKIDRKGFGKHLFHEWRYLDYEGTKENPDFILNKPQYRKASVLLTRDNFGCGSSREHAPWALADFGFRVIIAPSFADIFFNNCSKNGILLVPLTSQEVDNLFKEVTENPPTRVTADLEKRTIETSNGNEYTFDINEFTRECLLNGLDQIGWTEKFKDKIEAFERSCKKERPWLT